MRRPSSGTPKRNSAWHGLHGTVSVCRLEVAHRGELHLGDEGARCGDGTSGHSGSSSVDGRRRLASSAMAGAVKSSFTENKAHPCRLSDLASATAEMVEVERVRR